MDNFDVNLYILVYSPLSSTNLVMKTCKILYLFINTLHYCDVGVTGITRLALVLKSDEVTLVFDNEGFFGARFAVSLKCNVIEVC